MLKNYFIIATRTLSRNKIFSLINISGLTIGILSCLFAALFLREEFSFDRFHTDADRIYRVSFDNYDQQGPYATTPLPVGPALQEEIPDIQAMTRVQTITNYLTRFGENAFFEQMTVVDSGFFRVFSFRLLRGDPGKVLAGPNQIVISDKMARKYFGTDDAVGKMLSIGTSGRLNSVITGVVESPPVTSQLQFDFLLSISTLEKLGMPTKLWFQMPGNFTYLLLNPNASVERIESLFPALATKYAGAEMKGPYETTYHLVLEPLTGIHLNSHRQSELPTQGSSTMIYLFIAIAAVILLIACINYVNLTSARYLKRAREIGLRKVVGAGRWQLIGQLVSESLILSIGAGLLAIAAADLLLPLFNELAGTHLEFRRFNDPILIGIALTVVLVPALVAGLFPALFLVRARMVDALKGIFKFSPRRVAMQKGLVVFQFFSALLLLTATFVVFRQMEFIRSSLYQHTSDEQVLVFPLSTKLAHSFDALRNGLGSDASIMSLSATSSAPGFNSDSWEVKTSLDAQPVRTENYVVDPSYLEAMQYKLLAGRNFELDRASDSAAFIITEQAVHDYGFGTPERAIGQPLIWGNGKKGEVIGVVRDFYFNSFREAIFPALLQQGKPEDWFNFAVLRLRTDDIQRTLSNLRAEVAKIDDAWVVDYHFMDENFEKIHRRDVIQGNLFGVFAVVAVIISCMGLLGLSIFSTTQRSKEMGVRKVFGATSASLLMLVAWDFVVLFLIACLISGPVSYYLANKWLSDFAYQTVISPDIFLNTAGLVLLAVLLTVGYQTMKTASINPAEALKSE